MAQARKRKGGLTMTFYKRHKILSLIFFISIFLLIKNSSIPYIFEPPIIIAYIFDVPQSNFWANVAQMSNTFTSAYVTSLIFYYMVNYLPIIKEEKNARDIIAPKLVSLYLYMSELLAMIKFAAEREHIFSTENIEDMDNLHIKDTTILCNKLTIKNDTQSGTCVNPYNLLKDCDKYRNLIKNICSEISCTPSFSYCDTHIIHIISEIQLADLLQILPESNDFLQQFKNIDITYFGLGKGYNQFIEIKKRLAPFVDTRLDYEMTDISEAEIQVWNEKQAEYFREHPEAIQILIANQNKND